MRATRALLAGSTVVAALVAVPTATPAGAAVTATSAGTVVTVSATGAATIQFSCSGTAKVLVNGVEPTPSLACSALTQATVTGDAENQSVYGSGLMAAPFTANPKLVATLGDGSDYLTETDQADQIDLGAGNDTVVLSSEGPNNTSVALGAGTGDYVRMDATSGDDTMTATSNSAAVTVVVTGGASTARTATGAELLYLQAGAGDDTISSVGVNAASSVDYVAQLAGPGDDSLTDGPVDSALYGDTGTNAFAGGAGGDAYWSASETDVLDGGSDASTDFIYDAGGLRSGSRTLTGFTSIDYYGVQTHLGDVTMRIRPGASGTALLTSSLTRPGQQVVPASLGTISPGTAYVGALPHRALLDVVANVHPVSITLPSTGGGLLDVTIPSGSWTQTGTTGTVTVTSTFGQVSSTNVAEARVHGPWTDLRRGFAHRVVRDLVFRFASESDLDEISSALAGGTATRAAVVALTMNRDEYRGLDVDRTFVKYLRRTSDPSGRAYWINSIRNGKALWRFRAQLFGSNEYFTKAGGSNESYVLKAYADVLGRAPDPSGRTYWTNKLNNGADRGSVALQFINSPEARRRLVDDQFLRFIDRLPTPAEQTTWVNALPSANGEQALIAFLAGSATYYNRS